MKKLLFLLLLTVSSYGQTLQNPTYGNTTTNTLKIKSNVQDNSATKIPVQSADGTINWVNKADLVSQTTAGTFARVNFTGDVSVVNSVNYYATNTANKGSVASVAQTVSPDDNQKLYFAQDYISILQPSLVIYPAGSYSGQFAVQVANNSVQQKFYIEVYKTNNLGVPIASGVAGATVGSLGVTLITTLESGLVSLTGSTLTNISFTGTLTGQLTLNPNERVRYHIAAEKVGTAGGTVSMQIFSGTNYNSYYDVPVPVTTDGVVNKSTVVGNTNTDALNTINGALIYKRTIAQIRALSGILLSNNFYTTDLGQEGNWYYDASDVTTADNTGTILVTADGKRIKRIIGNEIYVDWFGAAGNGVINDSPAIQAAQTAAESLGVNIIFSPKTYLINNTITFTKGVVWRGTNRGSSNFTCIRRGANVIGISIVGTSILASGTHINTPEFIDIRFGQGESRNYTANFMEIKAVSFLRIKNCRFDAIKGRSIYAIELFDSLISDTYFGQNGDPVNLLPVIELRSGADGYEYTNDIHFNNCIIESSYYTSVKTTGSNTNTIYFTDCKFESGGTNLFAVLDFSNSNVIELNTTVVSGKGDGITLIPELMKFSNCDLVDLNVYVAMGGTIGVGGYSPLTRVVTFDNCKTIKTNVLFAEGYKDITGSELIKFTGTYTESRLRIDGAIINSPTTPLKNISNIPNKYLPLGTTTINTDNIVIKNTPSTSGASGTFDLLSRNKSSGIDEKVTMSGTANFLAKYGNSSSFIDSVIQDNGTNVSIGAINANAKFNIISGSLTYSQLLSGVATNSDAQGITSFITAGSGVTGSFKTFRSVFSTSAASFTLPRVDHFSVEQGTIGAGSTVTEQNGFTVAASMVGAGSNYGFRGNLPAGANNWNTYNSGTAKNHFNGEVLIGTTTNNGIDKLQIVGTASGTVDATNSNQFVRYGQVSSLIGNTSGTYTPTAVAGTNVTSITAPTMHTYTKIGNIVTVYGYTVPSLTTTAIDASYTITLPVSRANTGTFAIGFGATDSPANTTKSVFVNSSSTTTATIMLTSTLTGSVVCRYSFQYDVTQ